MTYNNKIKIQFYISVINVIFTLLLCNIFEINGQAVFQQWVGPVNK